MSQLHNQLNAVIDLSHRAGAAIMDIYQQDFAVQQKADDSPLTQADLASHRILVAGLQALTPDIPCLSEEDADIAYAERKQWQRYWLIDPLDGTREFIKKNGEFTVNVALIDNGVPVLGVVHAPDQQTTWSGAQHTGAFKSQAGAAPQPIATAAADPNKPRVLVSKSHRSAQVDALLDKFPDFETLSVGSSLKFCMVAQGSADFYPRLGPTSEWDTGAAHAVLSAAGGRVTQTDGNDLRYNSKDSLLNPFFLAYGDTRVDWTAYLD